MLTIRDLTDTLTAEGFNDAFIVGYLQAFINTNLVPNMTKKAQAQVQRDLQHHIFLSKRKQNNG